MPGRVREVERGSVGEGVPRVLSRADAARYCGVKPRTFSDWTAKKILPGPIPGTTRWDRKALDLALDRQSGIAEGVQNAAEAALAKWEQFGDKN